MKEKGNMFREAIIIATENMQKLYELSGGVEHDGEKGAFREFFITRLIRPIMPPHFGIGSGIVMDADNVQSKQSDVIIYDQRLFPPILVAGDRGIFPIDSVLAVIEVKSCLKATDYISLESAARRISPRNSSNPEGLHISTPAITKDGMTHYPVYAVFAYTSDAKKKDEVNRLEEEIPNRSGFIRIICVLDKGIWSYREEEEKYVKHSDIDAGKISVRFLFKLLDDIEEVAEERGKYRLRDWLL